MCIVCGIANCSRGLVAMLPWLLLPAIAAWALSHLLPPAFRLDLTSHRLACLALLLATLLWYDLILPRLTSWRHRRAHLLRDRDRLHAHRLARRRKEAIRHCRNCHLAYRDQLPPSTGRYMCSYCGHASKKPELHLPGEPPRPGGGGGATRGCESECWRVLWEEVEKFRSWLRRDERVAEGTVGRKAAGREAEDAGERRRRKAEERRAARVERERKEEEERREREEIRGLVEERSRWRAEEEAAAEREREREAERRRVEVKKSKDVKNNVKPEVVEAVEGLEREAKSPELVRRRDRYFSRHQQKVAGIFSGGSQVTSPVSRSKTSLSSSARNPVDGRPASTPATVNKEMNGSRLSWSSVLSGSYSKPSSSPRNSSPAVSPQAPSTKSSPASVTRSSRVQQLFPDPNPKLAEVPSPSPAPVSSSDPIYLPRAAPALPPISAPNSTGNSEPESSPRIFTPFFSPPVLPPGGANHRPLTSSTPLSADAPPFNSINFPPSFPSNNTLHLPDDLCVFQHPLAYRDPISGRLMFDPVTSSDGYSYERDEIQTWFQNNDSSPITGMQLPSAPPADTVDRRLWTNHHLQSQINDYREQRKARERAVSWSNAAVAAPGKLQSGGLYVDPLWTFGGEPGRVSNL